MTQTVAIETVLNQAGTGPFQRRLLGIFGLVWAADAMQVLAVGFTAASIAASFGLSVPEALQTGTLFFLGMLVGAALFGRLADRYGRRNILLITVGCDAVFGLLSVFAPNFLVLLGLRFLTGMAVGGTLPVDYAMMAEFLPPRNRGRWLVLLEGFWAIGTHRGGDRRVGHVRARHARCLALDLRRHRGAGADRHLAAAPRPRVADAPAEGRAGG